MTNKERKELRRAVADYMYSEGCGCCRNHDVHKKHEATLGKLLNVPQYSDKSGYDFYKFRTDAPNKERR